MHVGLIVPASNTVMEPDFHRALDATAVVSTTRIYLEEVSARAELRMIEEELPRALRVIASAGPEFVVFGCTSAGSLGGLTHDADIARIIKEATGAEGVTVVGSVLRRLQDAGARTVALFTPYRRELTQTVAACLEEAGHQVVTSSGMGILDNRAIGSVSPREIADFVLSEMPAAPPDAVFLSCTNWQSIAALDILGQALHVPIITSNQACIDILLDSLSH